MGSRLRNIVLRGVSTTWSLAAGGVGERDSIICWHSVHPNLPFRTCTPEEFRDQIDRIAEACEVVPVAELLEARPASASRPRVALTFDDGYADNHEVAFPILAERGLPAAFFMIAGFIEGDPAALERMRMLRSRWGGAVRPMSWAQLQELADAGMEIGCHTYSHPSLHHVAAADAEFELSRGKQVIEERLGQAVRGLAYPFGKPYCTYGPREVAACRSMGFRYAVTTVRRRLRRDDSRWELPRLSAERGDFPPILEQVEGRWDWLGVYNERTPAWLARRISPRGFRASTYGGTYQEMQVRAAAKR